MTVIIKLLILIAVLIATSVQVVSGEMNIRFYTGQTLVAAEWSMTYSYTQKCYTFNSCMDKKAIAAKDCQGTKLISHTIPAGKLMFPFKNGPKSFMVWSDGMYATNGIAHECLERISFNVSNITTSRDYPDAGDVIVS
ncbi:Hypothetical protein PHPALM_19691 [Phytophthora palmivora]|uniref:Uncharacterized protein n=1 Tax=Phytophthora palmivora TaxID=4796 RepID=A0A2P4XGS0_9STRA|nr:Hypothetical protein PHPALM_19691 [Phytophthora palmivora]